jgi:hypothetical protein
MKTLRHYLVESVRTYRYTIKIAGDCDSKFLDMFKHNLSKFDPVKIEDPKTTPIQKDPYGFPELQNESITIIKVEFKYPATEPMIQQCAQACGCQIGRVRVVTTDYDESINAESEQYANEKKDEPLLLTTELEDNGKEASKEYANQYLDKVVPKKPSVDIPYAGKQTPTSPNKSKEGINTVSPMGNGRVRAPEKPKTGAGR